MLYRAVSKKTDEFRRMGSIHPSLQRAKCRATFSECASWQMMYSLALEPFCFLAVSSSVLILHVYISITGTASGVSVREWPERRQRMNPSSTTRQRPHAGPAFPKTQNLNFINPKKQVWMCACVCLGRSYGSTAKSTVLASTLRRRLGGDPRASNNSKGRRQGFINSRVCNASAKIGGFSAMLDGQAC
jgi:hypothetical protein